MKKKSYKDNAIRLIKTQGECLTKFGGKPNLPESISWPLTADGRELDFLAQIHFAELKEKTALPETGSLFVFYSDSKNWKVIYTEAPLPESLREPAKKGDSPWLYRESRRKFKLLKTKECDIAPCHQMLGTPYCLQHNDMAPGYQLLLQLDSDLEDNGPGWMWGDVGILYFFIKPEELSAQCFDNIKVIWECC